MRILVTGGLGFIGSHLVDRLLEEGHDVTIVDSCVSNVMPPEEYTGLCAVVTQSVESLAEPLVEERHGRFDEIYHLASLVGPAGVLPYAGRMAAAIVRSAEIVADIALRHDARLLIASTSEIYGRDGALGEDDSMAVSGQFTIRMEYGVAKLVSEIAAVNRARVSPLKLKIVRPFNVGGPRQLPEGGFVLPRFVVAALRGEPITVFGNGMQVRAFTDVRDVVRCLLLAQRGGHADHTFNVGNPANRVTVRFLAERVKALCRSASPIVHVDPKAIFGPLYEEAARERVPVHWRASEVLGWRPAVALDETIGDVIDWYRARPERLAEARMGAVPTEDAQSA